MGDSNNNESNSVQSGAIGARRHHSRAISASPKRRASRGKGAGQRLGRVTPPTKSNSDKEPRQQAMPKNCKLRHRRPGSGLVLKTLRSARPAFPLLRRSRKDGPHARGRFQSQARSRLEGPRVLQVLDTHRAHGVQDGDDRHAYVAEHGKPHVGDAECCQH